MFRVLQVVTYMGRGGLETMLMNYYRHMDRSRIQFDFLVHRDFQADYDGEIESLGGRIYRVPRLNPLSPGYYRALNRFFFISSLPGCTFPFGLYERIPVAGGKAGRGAGADCPCP